MKSGELCHQVPSRLDLMGEQFESDATGHVGLCLESLCVYKWWKIDTSLSTCWVKCFSLLQIHNWISILCHTQNHKPHLIFFLKSWVFQGILLMGTMIWSAE